MSADELLAVFPSTVLEKLGRFEGITFSTNKYLSKIFEDNLCFLERSEAENNPSFKQLVSYIIIRAQSKVFSFRRSRHGEESRLSEMFSLGIGGHLRKDDIDQTMPTFTKGLMRELEEEVRIERPYSEKTVALINDDTDDVGKVHFGIVHVISLKKPKLSIIDTKAIDNGEFREFEHFQKQIHVYENWSKICILNLEKLLDLSDEV